MRGAPGLQLDQGAKPRPRRLQVAAGGVGDADQQADPGQHEAAAVQQRVVVDRQQLGAGAPRPARDQVEQREVAARRAVGGRLAGLRRHRDRPPQQRGRLGVLAQRMAQGALLEPEPGQRLAVAEPLEPHAQRLEPLDAGGLVLPEPGRAAQQRLRARGDVLLVSDPAALQQRHGRGRIGEEAMVGEHQLGATASPLAAASAASVSARAKSPPLPTIHAQAASARARSAPAGAAAARARSNAASASRKRARARNQKSSARHSRSAFAGSVSSACSIAAARFAASSSSAAKASG